MANVVGSKWGSSTLGTPGGTVTWSIAGAGLDISRFGTSTKTSVSGNSFLDYNYTKVIADAFAEWSKYGDIEFKQVADGGGAAGVGNDADIRIFFGEIPGGTAGYAFYPSSWGSAIAGDVMLDTLDRFNTDPLLFASVVLHELGHSLGLGHVDSDSIMTSTVRKIGLQADDIEGIQEIYGVQDDAPTNPGPTPDPDPTPDPTPDPDVDPTPPPPPPPDTSEDQRLVGSGGSDTILGNEGNDTLIGRGGWDRLYGGDDDDLVDGGSGNDKLVGNYGNDRLLGKDGKDVLKGGHGRDKLEGGNQNDLLRGGSQEDILIGGAGNDILRGEKHSDRFVFANNHGHDKVMDFNANTAFEKIDLRNVDGFDSFGDVSKAAKQVNKHVVITTDDDSSITLHNVQLNHLDAGDFWL
ncbi:matrixin family metalloprotease [uncultured Roseovarius sp.]|uniref:matrixin family metalloprotease n=1 Tax=uncultured Roseovarius sp. TaxID=293344 RepID=UPI00260A9CC9|nr:matrixin family metalloprotease [uncultured Roseovarius sp.]